MSPFRKSSVGGKSSGAPKPSEAEAEPPKKGAASEAFGQVRDAIPGSTIETAVGYVPGGGLATSGFKAAKGLGGLGFAMGSAGATAVSKKRKKSKASGDAEVVDMPDNESRPDGTVPDGQPMNGDMTKNQSPQSRLPQGQLDHKSGYDTYGPVSTTYYSGTNDSSNQAYTVPGGYSAKDLPPVTEYTTIQPYTNDNIVEFSRLNGEYPRTNGHMHPANDFAPSSEIINTTSQLEPVVHERVRRVEVEEVTRQIILDRHIHHVQHHTQPVMVREVLEEKHHQRFHPMTTVFERHANNAEDAKALDSQVQAHDNTVEHMEPERSVVDKGSIIQEKVHHHVHHIIQPVLEKDTVDQHRIHTRIPINEATHDIPVTREPQADGTPFVHGITGKEGFPAGQQEAIIPGAEMRNSPTGHCKGCNCGEMQRTSQSFDKGTAESESPRQDNGSYQNNHIPRKNSISVT